MSNRNFLFEIFAVWNSRSIRYGRISCDEEKKQKSSYFGVASITESILTVVFLVAGIWLMMNFLDFASTSVLLMIFLLIVGVATLVAALRTVICAVIDLVYQMRMNRKAIRWIALAVFILAIVASVVIVILIA